MQLHKMFPAGLNVLHTLKHLMRKRTPVTTWRSFHKSYKACVAQNFSDYESIKQNYKSEVPEYFNFASDVLDNWARMEKDGKKPSNPALWWIDDEGGEVKWSFEELEVFSKKVANILSDACGLKKNDRVIVILPRIPEWWLINVACIRAGIVLIPATSQLTAKDIHYRLQASKASCIITSDTLAREVDSVVSDCHFVKTKLIVPEGRQDGWLNFKDLFKAACEDHNCVKTKSEDPMTIFFTSGTTGLPKMAQHTHCSYGIGHVVNGRYWLDLTPSDIIWTFADTGWAKCAWSNVFAPWIQGSCVFIHRMHRFDALTVINVLCNYPITTFCMAPSGYRMLVQHNVAGYQFKRLKHCVSAGEPINPEVTEQWKTHTGLDIYEGYGQTETHAIATLYSEEQETNSKEELIFLVENTLQSYNEFYKLKSLKHCVTGGEPLGPYVVKQWRAQTGLDLYEGYGQTESVLVCGTFKGMKIKPGSMGKPAPGYYVQIIDENENILPPGEEGDIAISVKPKRPFSLFSQYIDDPQRTNATIRGSFYLTGDRGVKDDDGYFWFIGRSDDVILTSGYRIGPFEVENALIEHPAVAESAVVSSPDPIRGEIVKAFVVLLPAYKSHDPQELIKELQEHVKKVTAPYKYPRKVEFVPELPKTVSGKIRRTELRNKEWGKASND